MLKILLAVVGVVVALMLVGTLVSALFWLVKVAFVVGLIAVVGYGAMRLFGGARGSRQTD